MASVAELKERIFRTTGGRYTDQYHMVDLMNDALNQLVDGAKLEATSSINVTNGTSSYALPTNFKAPISLIEGTLDNPSIIYPLVNIDEYVWGYTIFNGNLTLKPEPNENKTLTLYYYKYATQLVDDTDEPDIDAQYHDLLATYAAGMILLTPSMVDTGKGMADRLLPRWDQGKQQFFESMLRKRKRSTVNRRSAW